MKWESRPLAEVSQFFTDGDWIESRDQSADGIRLIQTGNIGEGAFKDRGEKARYISQATFERLRCTEIFEGDCLISRLPDPVGRACLLPNTGARMITAVDCTIVRLNAKYLLPQFFNYYSQSDDYLRSVDNETTGTTRRRISRSKLGKILIPIPSLAEQHRIVGTLDEAFDGLTAAKVNAEKNLQNASAIFKSRLKAIFSNSSKQVSLHDITAAITDGDHMPPPKAVSGVPFITISDIVKSAREVDFRNTFFVPRVYFSRLKANKKPKVGDVLYTVTGSFGIPVLVKEQRDFCFQRHIALLRPAADVNSRWLTYALLSPQAYKQASALSTGTAQKTVSLTVLRRITVPKVKFTDQIAVADELDLLYDRTQELESIYRQKLAALEALKKSLLHEAFSGNL